MKVVGLVIRGEEAGDTKRISNSLYTLSPLTVLQETRSSANGNGNWLKNQPNSENEHGN